MKIIFLDIDGCLNDHTVMENSYCGINLACASLLNQLLRYDDVQLVISSAWRYLVLKQSMTLRGFEEMLLTHGLCCFGRVHGVTNPDEMYWSTPPTPEDWADLTVRARQIQDYVALNQPQAYVVFDDLDIPVSNLVRTNGQVGLTQDHIETAKRILSLTKVSGVPV